MRRTLTKEICFAIASTCKHRFELQQKDCYVYKLMLKNGWLDEVFPAVYNRPHKWTYETLKEIASAFPTRNAFKWGNWNAYHAARRRDFFEDICSHMKTISQTDGDVLYLLRTDKLLDGETVYKVGITSERNKKNRLSELKYTSRVSFDVIFWVNTPDAKTFETIILGMGILPEVKYFKGYKEVRMFSRDDLTLLKELFNSLGGV